ncbi:MAG: hypothetical protein AAF806_31650 [Bacteroidota bacterium]
MFQVEKISPDHYDFKDNYFKVILSTKTDLVKLEKQEKGANTYLFCPMTFDKPNAESLKKDPIQIHGSFLLDRENAEKYQKGSKYYYEATSFIKAKENTENIDLKEILNKDCIRCKVVIAYFPFTSSKKGSFSEAFCLSGREVLAAIKEEE